MHEVNADQYASDTLQRLVHGITFFREVISHDPDQFNALMEVSRILEADAGETLIQAGDTDASLYFLLKGQLAVSVGEGNQVINYISPGEVFGTLSMVRGIPRSATIQVDPNSKGALVMQIDFKYFRDITDFSQFTLETKLAFYRLVVHNIRWTLEVNKMENPAHELVNELRKVKLYVGPKGTPEELEALHSQAFALAEILTRWNDSSSHAPVHQ